MCSLKSGLPLLKVRSVRAFNIFPVGVNPTITLERREDEDEMARVPEEIQRPGQEAGIETEALNE
jgi:hypothetical protein